MSRAQASDRTERNVAAFYDNVNGFITEKSRFFNQGYWKDETASQDDACRALVRLVGQAADLKSGDRVLDAGCGYGDQLVHWVNDFWVDHVTGITLSLAQIKAASELAQSADIAERITLKRMSATELEFPEASFDKVVAVESGHHFQPRKEFFSQALRVLKPGGRFAACDILPMPKAMAGRYGWVIDAMRRFPNESMMPRANVVDRATYRSQLQEAGFVNVQVVSIREHVYAPMARSLRRRLAAGQINPLTPLLNVSPRMLLNRERLHYMFALTQMLSAIASPFSWRQTLHACEHGPLDYVLAVAEAPAA
jgi:cyclopropane fatty-acyl-phospholipid synthase-like methyltransferase